MLLTSQVFDFAMIRSGKENQKKRLFEIDTVVLAVCACRVLSVHFKNFMFGAHCECSSSRGDLMGRIHSAPQ